MPHRGGAVAARREIGLLLGFQQMRVDAGVVALGQLRAQQQRLVGAAVRIGRRGKDRQPRPAVPFADRGSPSARDSSATGCGFRSSTAAHARACRSSGSGAAGKMSLNAPSKNRMPSATRMPLSSQADSTASMSASVKRWPGKWSIAAGGAAGHHAVGGQQHAEADFVGRAARRVRLGQPHEGRMAQPVAEARHGARLRMGVRVDEAGRDQPVACSRCGGPDASGPLYVAGADRRDPAVADQHVAAARSRGPADRA